MLVCHGYTFSKTREVRGTQYWKCTFRDTCSVTAVTNAEELVKEPAIVHPNHAPDIAEVVRREVGAQLRQQGRDGTLPAVAVQLVVSVFDERICYNTYLIHS